jgi:hypothetical protein
MILAMAAALALGLTATQAQQPVTVKSLLAQQFVVVGTITNVAGGGVYLQNKDKLFFCNVTETPTSSHGGHALLQAGRMAGRRHPFSADSMRQLWTCGQIGTNGGNGCPMEGRHPAEAMNTA